MATSIEILGTDELSLILGFLHWKDILKARVNQQWRDAVKITLVPISRINLQTPPEPITGESEDKATIQPEFFIQNKAYGHALWWICQALPMLQCIYCDFSLRRTKVETFQVCRGEGSNLGDVLNQTPVSFRPIANLQQLRHLSLRNIFLHGHYDFLFNFPELRTLDISGTNCLKWDLTMLSGLPKLEKLLCIHNHSLTGDLKNLRVLINSLSEINFASCGRVEGSLMTLADFPKLQKIDLTGTKVTGDIREIGPNDFSSIKKEMELCYTPIYGGGTLMKIEDAPEVMLAHHNLKKRNQSLFHDRDWRLSYHSPQYFDYAGHFSRQPPFRVEFVKAGSRLGWRWTNCKKEGSCETQWLDPEPNSTDEGYEKYLRESKHINNDVVIFRGFKRPPNQQEHIRRCSEVPLDRSNFSSDEEEDYWEDSDREESVLEESDQEDSEREDSDRDNPFYDFSDNDSSYGDVMYLNYLGDDPYNMWEESDDENYNPMAPITW